MLTHPRKDSAWWPVSSDGGSGTTDEGLGTDRRLEKANRKALFGQGNEKHRLEKLLAPCFMECMKPDGRSLDEDFGSDSRCASHVPLISVPWYLVLWRVGVRRYF